MSPWLGHYPWVIMGMQLQVVLEGNPVLELKRLRGASPPWICGLKPRAAERHFASAWLEDHTNTKGQTRVAGAGSWAGAACLPFCLVSSLEA